MPHARGHLASRERSLARSLGRLGSRSVGWSAHRSLGRSALSALVHAAAALLLHCCCRRHWVCRRPTAQLLQPAALFSDAGGDPHRPLPHPLRRTDPRLDRLGDGWAIAARTQSECNVRLFQGTCDLRPVCIICTHHMQVPGSRSWAPRPEAWSWRDDCRLNALYPDCAFQDATRSVSRSARILVRNV